MTLAKLKKAIKNTDSTPEKDISVLLDDSGSVSDQDFATSLSICNNLIQVLKEGDTTGSQVKISVIAFHSKAETISHLNDNSKLVCDAVNRYTRKRGTTNLVDGLQSCMTSFQAGRSRAKKLVFVITDGVADRDPFDKAFELKGKHNATVFAIGIGSGVSMENLNKFGTFGCCFLANNYAELEETLRQGSAQEINEKAVNILVNNPKSVSFGEPLNLELRIENVGLKRLGQLRLDLRPTGYFCSAFCQSRREGLEPGQSEFVTVKLLANGDDFSTIPTEIPFTVVETSGHVKCLNGTAILMSSEWFRGKFVDYPPPRDEIPSINILMFGVAGSGKSSFVNSVLTSLQGQVLTPALVGGTTAHVTRDIRSFRLNNNFEGLGDCRITLWDTWGIDETNYQCDLLLKILAGQIPDGYQMSDVNVTSSPNPGLYNHQIARQIHAVFLFVPIGILQDDLMILKIKEVLNQTNTMRINAVLIVTRADTVADPYSRQKKIAQEFAVPESRVKMIANYTKNDQAKDFSIDKKTLTLVDAAVEQAKDFINIILSRPSAEFAARTSTVVKKQSSPFDEFVSSPQQNQRPPQQQQQKPLQTFYNPPQQQTPPRSQPPTNITKLLLKNAITNEVEGRIQNVQDSVTASELIARAISELGESFANISLQGLSKEEPIKKALNNGTLVFSRSQVIQKLLLVDSSSNSVEGRLTNVDSSTTIAELLIRVKRELGASFTTITIKGDPQQPISSILDEGKIFFTKQGPRLAIKRNGGVIGGIKDVSPSDKLISLRQKIQQQLGISDFKFVDCGVPISPNQEQSEDVASIIENNQVTIK